MKPTILVVDDNTEILLNLEITLECNDYKVITTNSGKEALKILREADKLPDLIISDIMMPEMDGYEFYKTVTNNQFWNQIPFIFLSAKASIDDIRFGKMLGVDDYLTKPFKDEDLLASVAGKIARVRKSNLISKRIEEKLTEIGVTSDQALTDEDIAKISLFWMLWDEMQGPILKGSYPCKDKIPYSISTIGSQLFHGTVVIYGYDDYSDPQGVLLNIKNINMDGYIFFDMTEDDEVRGGQRQFMIALIAPKINYLDTGQIKYIFSKMVEIIKNGKKIDLKDYWTKLTDILTNQPG
ncbi:MAG: response regulator [Candidatus Hodarchaeales archaeon]